MNKPVAWLNGNEICPEIGYESTITTKHPKDLGWIPLYTHTVKELTDEDLDAIMVKVETKLAEQGCYIAYCCNTIRILSDAILRKAQEK